MILPTYCVVVLPFRNCRHFSDERILEALCWGIVRDLNKTKEVSRDAKPPSFEPKSGNYIVWIGESYTGALSFHFIVRMAPAAAL